MELEKEKKKDKWQEALISGLREASLGQSTNLRTSFQYGQAGHFRRECPWRKLLLGTCPICRGKYWKAHSLSLVLRGTKARASHQMMVPESPIQAPETTIIAEKTQEKHKVSLLINTGASISAIPFSAVPRSSKKITV
jgi:hypothetical protein